jgi:hypothetical protein
LAAFTRDAKPLRAPSPVEEHAEQLRDLTERSSFARVRDAIAGYAGNDPWLQQATRSLLAASPTSVALVWEIFRRARDMTFAEALRQDLVAVLQCYARRDFPEGVRALVIDKDRRPRWTPATAAEVSAQAIEDHLIPRRWANADGLNPLSDLI